jgi:DNA repair photolyase
LPLIPELCLSQEFIMTTDPPDFRPPRGRGAASNPDNRFLTVLHEKDFEQLQFDDEFLKSQERPNTQYFHDTSQSIISENNSPDIPFRYSLNPYRGCLHGCSYCYARPTHEYLGLSAGLDFETRIFVKPAAPSLFRDWLTRPAWKCEAIMLSGVTDCYQPVERKLQVTRQCLQVALEARQPVSVITKNALISRDTDVLGPLAELQLCRVAISLSSLDQSLTKLVEPACSAPASRLQAIRTLTAAGIPVHLMVAPVIPGLNDSEIPAVLNAAAEAGARSASFIIVRLPLTVEPVFLEWLNRHFPDAASRVLNRIRATRDGQLNQSQFHQRMRGSGIYAEQIAKLFQIHRKRCQLDQQLPPSRTDLFRTPKSTSGQQFLF